jgi:hypothetical protein
MRIFASTLLVTPAILLSARRADSQSQLLASEPASISQTVDGTKVTVTYFRPRARGRSGLFGSQIKWGSTWTPGANSATRLEVSNDVTIHGQPVPRGAYSVWFVVGREQWQMVLDRDTALFHTQPPKPRAGQVRFVVPREKRQFMEALTWSFPEVSTTGMTLMFHWDTVSVPLRVKVAPSYTTTVVADAATRVVGRYAVHFEPIPEPPKDSTLADDEELPARDVTLAIRYERGELRATMDPPMYKTEPGYRDWTLLPRGEGWYRLGRMYNGELVEVFDFMQLQFDLEAGGRAKGLELRATNDALVAKGTRLP